MVVEFKGKEIEFDEIVDVFDTHHPYCQEVEVHGTDNEDVEYSAIGISDGFDVIEIDEDTIECIDETEYLESLVDNNPDDGSWVGR